MQREVEPGELKPRRIAEEPTAFRDAFARARLESLGFGSAAESPAVPGEAARAVGERPVFEVRIEKRSGRRSKDVKAWNRLGRKGWELVGVQGKHVFFRRRR